MWHILGKTHEMLQSRALKAQADKREDPARTGRINLLKLRTLLTVPFALEGSTDRINRNDLVNWVELNQLLFGPAAGFQEGYRYQIALSKALDYVRF